MAKTAASSAASGTKKRKRSIISDGRFYIQATFNNTIVTVTDRAGNVLRQSSAGACGFKGSRRSTPYAAQVAAEKVGLVAKEEFGMKTIAIYVKGPGPGRESTVRKLTTLGFKVHLITDVTKIPFNGCRPRKKRRA